MPNILFHVPIHN